MLSCSADIAGTITLLIIKHDEQTGNFRDQSGVLQEYAKLNKLPRVSHMCTTLPFVYDCTQCMYMAC